MELEESLVGLESLGNALGVVESVDAEHDLLAAGAPGARRLAGTALVLRVVDPEREVTDARDVAAVLDLPALSVDAGTEQAVDGVEEVVDVAGTMEADQVAGQQAAQDLAVVRESAVDVEGREGDVEEERDPGGGPSPPDDLGAEREVIVVDPDEVVLLRLGEDRLGEALVDGFVGAPVVAVVARALGQRVEERPEDTVRVAVVEALDLGGAERDRAQVVARIGDLDRLARLQLCAGPADPRPAAALHRRRQRGDQSSG